MCNNLYVKPYSKLHHMIRTQSSPEVDKMYILQVVRRSCSCLCLPLLLLCVYVSVSVLGVVWLHLSPLYSPCFSFVFLLNMYLPAWEPIYYSAAPHKAPTHLVLIIYRMEFPNMAAERSPASCGCWIIIAIQDHRAKLAGSVFAIQCFALCQVLHSANGLQYS